MFLFSRVIFGCKNLEITKTSLDRGGIVYIVIFFLFCVVLLRYHLYNMNAQILRV